MRISAMNFLSWPASIRKLAKALKFKCLLYNTHMVHTRPYVRVQYTFYNWSRILIWLLHYTSDTVYWSLCSTHVLPICIALYAKYNYTLLYSLITLQYYHVYHAIPLSHTWKLFNFGFRVIVPNKYFFFSWFINFNNSFSTHTIRTEDFEEYFQNTINIF